MMLRNILFIILLYTQLGYAQDFYPLVKTPLFETTVHAESLANGNIFVLINQRKSYWVDYSELTYEEMLLDLPFIDNTYGRIILYDQDMKLLKNHAFKSNNDSIYHCHYFDINEQLNEIVVWATLVTKNGRTRKAFWLDYELKVKKEVVYNDSRLNFAHDGFDFFFLVNSKNNIICNTGSFSVELDDKGNLVRSSKSEKLLGHFFVEDTLNQQYFAVDPTAVAITDFNLSSWSFIQIPSLVSQSGILTWDLSDRVAPNFNKQYFLVNTFGYCDSGSNRGLVERILKYDISNPKYTVEVLYEDTLLGCINDKVKNGFFGIDMFYDDYIYFTNVIGWCYLIPPLDQDPSACSSSYNTIKCLNEKGDLRWSHTVGGDASYRPSGVVATKDSGCVVFVYRYEPLVNTQHECDLYYLKFDKEGNVQVPDSLPLSLTDPSNHIQQNIVLYPNPVKDVLYLNQNPTTNKNLFIEIYNTKGQLILSKKVNSGAIEVQHLPGGIYAYTLRQNGKILKRDKLLKL